MATRDDDRAVVGRDNRLQPDPELREGKAGAAKIALTTLGAIAIVVLVLYGLNRHKPEAGETTSAPASQTAATPAPSPNAPPAAASNVKPAQRPNNLADQPAGDARGKQAAQPSPQQQASQPAAEAPSGNQPGQPASDSARTNVGNENTGSAAPTERRPAPSSESNQAGGQKK
jgi:FtsZ-interacting cell division protein ZipA